MSKSRLYYIILFLCSFFRFSFSVGPTIKSGMSQRQGDRSYMEDYVAFLPEEMIFGIFDGHAGDKAAQIASTMFPNYLKKDPLNKELINNAFEQIDELIKSQTASGACAIIAHINLDKNLLTLINLGDSRAIVGRNGKIIFSTTDHKPNTPEEKQRIESQGGTVMQDKYGTWRVLNNTGGGLAVSRTLGDKTYKEPKSFVSNIPDITQINIELGDWIILGSDGIWDVLDNKKTLKVVENSFHQQSELRKKYPYNALKRNNNFDQYTRDKGDLQMIARAVRDTAYKEGSPDNLSVIVLHVK